MGKVIHIMQRIRNIYQSVWREQTFSGNPNKNLFHGNVWSVTLSAVFQPSEDQWINKAAVIK